MNKTIGNMKKIYVARASFYDTECFSFTLCSGFNKKEVKKEAVKLLKKKHEEGSFPDYYFGNRPVGKIDGHFIELEEVPYVD